MNKIDISKTYDLMTKLIWLDYIQSMICGSCDHNFINYLIWLEITTLEIGFWFFDFGISNLYYLSIRISLSFFCYVIELKLMKTKIEQLVCALIGSFFIWLYNLL